MLFENSLALIFFSITLPRNLKHDIHFLIPKAL